MGDKQATKGGPRVRRHGDLAKQPYDPSQQEIAEACERIQAGWSAEEKNRRRCAGVVEQWAVPTIELFDCDRDLDE